MPISHRVAKRRKSKQSDLDQLLEGLLYLAFVLAIVVAALAVLAASALIDLAAIVVCKLRKVEHRGMRLSRGFIYFAIHRQRRPAPVRVETLGELLALSATQFEEAIAQSLRDHGYRDVRRCGGPGDLGVDITCTDPNGGRLAVQCKRYAPGNLVGSRDLQLFIGMTHTEHQVDRGVYITTSSYTVPARQLANRHNIRLVDGPELSRTLKLTTPTPTATIAPAPDPVENVLSSDLVDARPSCVLSHDELQALEALVNQTGIELPLAIVKPLSAGAQPEVQFNSTADMQTAANLIEQSAQRTTPQEHDYRGAALIAAIISMLRNGGQPSYELPQLKSHAAKAP